MLSHSSQSVHAPVDAHSHSQPSVHAPVGREKEFLRSLLGPQQVAGFLALAQGQTATWSKNALGHFLGAIVMEAAKASDGGGDRVSFPYFPDYQSVLEWVKQGARAEGAAVKADPKLRQKVRDAMQCAEKMTASEKELTSESQHELMHALRSRGKTEG